MSIALPPVLVDDLPAYTNGPTYFVNTTIQPDRLSAVRIYNNTPFEMLVNNVPGVNQVWLSPYTEDIYVSNLDNPSSAFNSAMLGQLSISPVNLALRSNDTATTPIGFYHPYRVLVTVYEIGDAIPTGLPIVHNQMVSVVGEALSPTTFPFNTTFTSGNAGVLTGGITGFTAGNVSIDYASILAGFSLDLLSSGSQHDRSFTVAGTCGGTITFNINIPATTPFNFFRDNLNWMSAGVGTGNNNFTITFPAIAGVAGSITMWLYAERVP